MGIRITIEDAADSGVAITTVADTTTGTAAGTAGGAKDLDGGAPAADLLSALGSGQSPDIEASAGDPAGDNSRPGPSGSSEAGDLEGIDGGGPDISIGELIESLNPQDDGQTNGAG